MINNDTKNTLPKSNKSKLNFECSSANPSTVTSINNHKLKNDVLAKKYHKKNASTPNLSRIQSVTSTTPKVATVTINSGPSKTSTLIRTTPLNNVNSGSSIAEKSRQLRKIKYPSPNITSNTFTAHESTSSMSNVISSSSKKNTLSSSSSSPLDHNNRLLRRGSVESSCDTTTSSTGLIKNGYTKYVDTQQSNKLNNLSSDSNYYSANSGGSGKAKYSSSGVGGLAQCRHRSLEIDDHPNQSFVHPRKYSYPLPRQSSVDDRTSNHLKNLKNNYTSQVLSTNDLISQMYYENRFKNLEDKIRRHKTDVNSFVLQKQSQKFMNKHGKHDDSIQQRYVSANKGISPKYMTQSQSDAKLMKNMPRKYDTIAGNKLNGGGASNHHYHQRSATTDNQYKSFTCEDHNHGDKMNNNYKFNRRASNYGVISASDLYKLRSSEMIL